MLHIFIDNNIIETLEMYTKCHCSQVFRLSECHKEIPDTDDPFKNEYK